MRIPRGHHALLVTALAFLGFGCATRALPAPPEAFAGLPWGTSPLDRTVLRARHLAERGHQREAEQLLQPVLKEDARHVDALRLRQDILRTRGRTGLLRAENEAMLRDGPDDPVAHYLRGRLVPDPEAKLAAFRRAAELAPDALWPFLGLAHTLRIRAPEEALALYRRMYEATEKHPLVAIAYGETLRLNGRHSVALEVYAQLRGNADVPGTAELGLAQTHLAMEQRQQAWGALLAALRLRPFDPGAQALVRDWQRAGLSDEQLEQVLDVLREDPQRFAEFARSGGPVLAVILQRLQQPHAALAVLEGWDGGPLDPPLRRMQRRLLLSVGDVRGFLDVLAADVPPFVLDDESNRVRGIWLRLLRGPWREGDPLADPERSIALAEALLGAGLLAEVEQLAAIAARRWPDAEARLFALRDESRREIAFESALRRLLYQGYAQPEAATMDLVVARIRELSRLVLGEDVVGDAPRFSVPLIGEMLDPFEGGLGRHLARYNRHLVLGRRSGAVTEGLLVTRLSVRELEDDGELPLPGRCYEVLGTDRDVRSFSGVLGGDLAGVALLNHFVIDFDAVREWSNAIADRRRIAAEDGDALLGDALPEHDGGEPLDVAWRLAALSPVKDSELDVAVLETIRLHERQHLVDSFHYLPIEANLWRGLGLLLRFGLSADAIEAEMERRAELASLALTAHPELVLAHVADFAEGEGGESPHHYGFRRLARELTGALIEDGVDPAAAAPCRWHRLGREQVRQAARRLFERLR